MTQMRVKLRIILLAPAPPNSPLCAISGPVLKATSGSMLLLLLPLIDLPFNHLTFVTSGSCQLLSK
jgi:hypothetical protein